MSLTVLVDYDSGNLHSAAKAFERMAAEGGGGRILVSNRPEDVARADRIVLPGDGAFPACRRALDAVPGMVAALREAVEQRARPFLGICVGMQMLADEGRAEVSCEFCHAHYVLDRAALEALLARLRSGGPDEGTPA